MAASDLRKGSGPYKIIEGAVKFREGKRVCSFTKSFTVDRTQKDGQVY